MALEREGCGHHRNLQQGTMLKMVDGARAQNDESAQRQNGEEWEAEHSCVEVNAPNGSPALRVCSL